MKKTVLSRAPIVLTLVFVLCLPSPAFCGGKSGKKNFKEGAKHETTEQWDLAAEKYAMAVMDEPENAEYRMRLARALQMASLMFAARGDLLESKSDFSGAYTAYARAVTYDQTNETAKNKMARMLEQQRAKEGLGEARRYNPRTGVLIQASNEIKTQPARVRDDVKQRIDFKEGASLKLVIENLSRQLGLNVIFDDSFKDSAKFSLTLTDVTLAKALDLVLLQSKHIFEPADRRTIVIYADNQANRQRLERLLVKTFFLNNADLNETRTIVVTNLGQNRQVSVSKQLNALVVRATPAELAIAQSLIETLDKNRSEVVLDIDIYEVSNSASLALGNQLASSSVQSTTKDADGNETKTNSTSLADLGGLGRLGVSSLTGNLFNVGGGIGTLMGLPPSSLSLLQTKGSSKLLASTQVHALDGEQNQTVVGRSVPVRTGTTSLGATTTATNYTIDNIQYRDVGLVIDATPVITNEGYVQVKMKLESSNVVATGTDPTLTPEFTKRSLTTISRVQDGVTAVVACVKQSNKGDTRASIPVIGMLPILGRLFSAPQQSNSQSDIVITVTPHIIRSPDIQPDDHLARMFGTQATGASPTIEEVLYRAQADEEEERRAIARQAGASGTIIEASVGASAEKIITPVVNLTESLIPAAQEPLTPPSRVAPVKILPASQSTPEKSPAPEEKGAGDKPKRANRPPGSTE